MKRKLLLVALLLAFLAYAAWAFTDSVTPYVGIATAEQAQGKVQVKGLLAQDAPQPAQQGEDFLFVLQDEETGETMPVRYHGTKPDQFDTAHHIVAIGAYNPAAKEFQAEKLLIKCPSKYERQKG